MINGKKVVVVLPAYNAAKTLEITYQEIDFTIVDEVILVDDKSKDETIEEAHRLGIDHIIKHEQNIWDSRCTRIRGTEATGPIKRRVTRWR